MLPPGERFGLERTRLLDRLLDQHIERGRGGRIAFAFREQRMTYQELVAAVDQAAARLAEVGVAYGSRVALSLPDSLDAVTLILGAIRHGAVPVPLSARLPEKAYCEIIADCRPEVCIGGDRQADSASRVREVTGRPRFIGTVPDGREVPGSISWHEDVSDWVSARTVLTTPEDLGLIQYTSGSTGAPKGVLHTFGGLESVLDTLPACLEMTESDVVFSSAKLSFGYGFGNSLLFPLSVGATSVLHDGPVDPRSLIDICARNRPSILFATPSLYGAVMKLRPEVEPAVFASIRGFVSAGERLDDRLASRWLARFSEPILDGIGSTECLHIFSVTEPGNPHPGPLRDRIVPGYEVKVLGEDGTPADAGEPGVVWVRGRATSVGYWNRRQETERTMVGGWIRTGDVVRWDGSRGLRFLGREDDVLKVGGVKVAPTQIEAAILEHGAVREAAVIGVEDSEGLTGIVAYIVLDHDQSETWPSIEGEITLHVRRELGPAKTPSRLILVQQMPVTVTGKVSRAGLRDRGCEHVSSQARKPGR